MVSARESIFLKIYSGFVRKTDLLIANCRARVTIRHQVTFVENCVVIKTVLLALDESIAPKFELPLVPARVQSIALRTRAID